MKELRRMSLAGFLCFASWGTALRGQDEPSALELENAAPRRVALSPQDSLATIQVAGTLQIELVASEPEVIDPVAIRFDEAGRMWVVEMSDYPLGGHITGTNQPSGSRVKVLRDEDRNGYFETATIFADGLQFATGLQPWRDGVFVTMAGKVSYLQDTNDDGVADLEEVWYTGFAEENSQLRANDPTLSLDGRIYVANGLRGGQVVASNQANQPLSISGRDFWFDPRRRTFGVATGGGQFGMSFDLAGHRFICSNREPVVHVVVRNRYADILPTALPPSLKQLVAKSGFESRLFPISQFWTTSNLHEGQFTAACGVTVFLGNGLGDSYVGNVFTCDPTGNLVHREIISDAGASFTSRSPYESQEFLAADDTWFRPVNLETGPDGALYVVDMHRAVIEHPQFVPDELKQRPDQRWGDRQGRIFRIVHSANKTTRKNQWPLRGPSTQVEMRDWLAHDNAWHRNTAFRLLLDESLEPSDISAWEALVKSSSDSAATIQALAVLATHDSLRLPVLQSALSHRQPDVREFALNLLGDWIAIHAASDLIPPIAYASIRDCLSEGIADAHPRVRFQALLTLAESKLAADQRLQLLSYFPYEQELDSWQAHAMLLAAREAHQPWLDSLVAERRVGMSAASVNHESMISLTAEHLIRANDPAGAIATLLHAWSNDKSGEWTLAALRSMRAAHHERFAIAFREYLTDENELRQELLSTLRKQLLSDALDERQGAIVLLASMGTDQLERLEQEFATTEDPAYRNMLLSVLVESEPSLNFWTSVAANFQSETPTNRQFILDGLMIGQQRQQILLSALESGQIRASEIDVVRRQTILRRANATWKAALQSHLEANVDSDRAQVVQEYSESINNRGDAKQGKVLFSKHCAVCHRVGTLGTDVAPDISDSRIRSRQQLLADILQPNLAIDANYIAYVAETHDGKVHTGMIDEETGDTIVLRTVAGTQIRLLRSELASLLSTGKSLMPEGFEQDLTATEMNHLISFIKNWRYLESGVPAEGFDERR